MCGEWRYRFLTSPLMEVSGQLYVPAVLLPEKEPWFTIEQVSGWALEPVWVSRRREKSIAATGIRTSDRTGRNVVAIPSYPGH